MPINRIKGSTDVLAEVNASSEQLVKDTDVDTLLTAIKAKTDNLTDLASETKLAQIDTAIDLTNTKLTTIDSVLDSIKAQTDKMKFTGDYLKTTIA